MKRTSVGTVSKKQKDEFDGQGKGEVAERKQTHGSTSKGKPQNTTESSSQTNYSIANLKKRNEKKTC